MSHLSVRRLWQSYGDKVVLERINLEIESRSFVSIAGASGCGKSTFLRLVLGQERPTRGAILLDGNPLPPEPGPDRGVVFQRYSVFPHLTVLGNVILGLEIERSPLLGRLFGAARRRAIDEARHYLEAVGLDGDRERYPDALSGGMQQRLSIAQTLIRKPRVLLLDEPFGALDPGTRASMHELVLRLWSEHPMTVLMVTHDLTEAFKLGTRVLVFDKTRYDEQEPERYGATVTYDLALNRSPSTPPPTAESQAGTGPDS